MAYAKETEVPFERSVSEILGLLKRAGADQIGQWEGRGKFTLQFTMQDRMVEFRVAFPTPEELEQLRGPRQDAERVEQQWRRQRGRALLLVVKAKLESVESGVETFEQAFLANIVMANRQTLYERIRESIAVEYKTGAVQPTSALFLEGPRS